MQPQVGLDSQCLSYLIDIISSTSRISESVADQQLSLIRIYMYAIGTFFVTPQVQSECLNIPSPEYRESHESFMSSLFGVLPVNDQGVVEKSTVRFYEKHKKRGDCLVLAEAIDVGHDFLLTFDTRFVERLSGLSETNLLSPSSYWESLKIPKGSSPNKVPSLGNPLSVQDFWQW